MYTGCNKCTHQSAVRIINELLCRLSGSGSVYVSGELPKLTVLLLSIVGGCETISTE